MMLFFEKDCGSACVLRNMLWSSVSSCGARHNFFSGVGGGGGGEEGQTKFLAGKLSGKQIFYWVGGGGN